MPPAPDPKANGSLALARLPAKTPDVVAREERRYVPVVLRLPEDTWVEGELSMPPQRGGVGVRPYDVFERDTERLLRLINARVRMGTRESWVRSIAVLKSSVIYMYELSEAIDGPLVPNRPS